MSKKVLIISLFAISAVVGCAGSETKPAPAPPAQKQEAKKAEARAAAAKPAPEPAEAVEPASRKVTKAVTTAVNDWAAAWQARDVTKYLAAYAPDFKPEKGTRETWAKQRGERLAKSKDIKVTVSELQVKSPGDDLASASFAQSYASASYSDKEKKVLDLKKVDGKWLITREYTP
jgi:ketosteroid isomerase-like protein